MPAGTRVTFWDGVAAIVVGWAVVSGISAMWYSKTRYVVQYAVKYDQVTKIDKPHDCDFRKAPLGEKECHYDRTVEYFPASITSTDKNYNRPIISEDGGKTWNWNDGDYAIKPHGATVLVSWYRVDEEQPR